VNWRTAGLSLIACLAGSLDSTVAAQGVALDVSAGQIVYEPASAAVATNNAAATLRYDSPRGVWLYGTAALPFDGNDSRWGDVGVGDRFLHPVASGRRVSIGADIGVHGFAFRDAVVGQSGNGAFVDAMPFVQIPVGLAAFEAGAGWRGETLSYAGVVDRRHVFESRAHATYGSLWIVEGNARLVHAAEGSYPFFGGGLRYSGTPVQVWLQTGKWFSTTLSDTAWAAGIDVRLTGQLALWSSVRQDAPDPLYWNVPRRNWSVGITHRFGGRSRQTSVTAPQADPGGVLIHLSAADVDGAAVSVAGDFNGWRPVAMQREGREWLIRLPLAPGVYHYAFRSDRGQWFVPASVPNRRDDGMGGYVAVLVVS
jgi:AMP-activated protein kinase-like protein